MTVSSTRFLSTLEDEVNDDEFAHATTLGGGISGHVLAGSRRRRKCCAGSHFSGYGDRLPGRLVSVRSHRAYSGLRIGSISGGHFNPAVSLGLFFGKRFPASDLLPYIVSQVIGALVAAGVLYLIASGRADFDVQGGFAANGFGEHSPGGYSLVSALLVEVVLTFFFLLIILGSTDLRAPQGFAPIAIGLALTLIHLISIPVTNTSVNPARSTGPALFVGGWAISQLWVFWVAPIIGAALAGFVYRFLAEEPESAVMPEGVPPQYRAAAE